MRQLCGWDHSGGVSSSDVLTGRWGARGGCAVLLPISIFPRLPGLPQPGSETIPAPKGGSECLWACKSLPAEPDPRRMCSRGGHPAVQLGTAGDDALAPESLGFTSQQMERWQRLKNEKYSSYSTPWEASALGQSPAFGT